MAGITMREYERIPAREWLGVAVRTLGELRNGNMTISAGSVLTISAKRSRSFSLTGPRCAACGVSIHITRVHPSDVERVEEA